MHNLSKLAYCLGEGFASVDWSPVPGPTGEEICHEVPLPEVSDQLTQITCTNIW